jgi:hypothetical protein
MRRVEIAQKMKVGDIVCWELLEDISTWTREDMPRLDNLIGSIGRVMY